MQTEPERTGAADSPGSEDVSGSVDGVQPTKPAPWRVIVARILKVLAYCWAAFTIYSVIFESTSFDQLESTAALYPIALGLSVVALLLHHARSQWIHSAVIALPILLVFTLTAFL
ncbi:hypothetical protein [Marisediminicola senii]|uniref:hypothetical protein n=1 Tax=Marisediminicola senii TaxID=2711233 RepID=UPI0013EC297B|nr:hypothetical protein [Marisediminicola senii]